jgi:hypothetical protein
MRAAAGNAPPRELELGGAAPIGGTTPRELGSPWLLPGADAPDELFGLRADAGAALVAALEAGLGATRAAVGDGVAAAGRVAVEGGAAAAGRVAVEGGVAAAGRVAVEGGVTTGARIVTVGLFACAVADAAERWGKSREAVTETDTAGREVDVAAVASGGLTVVAACMEADDPVLARV